MPTHYSAPVNSEQNYNQDHPFFEDRVEEPPFVYLGAKYPPDLATDLPGHVYKFEQAWKEAKSVKIYELIGSPVFLHEKEIDDKSLEKELAGLIDLMQKNNISIDIPSGKEARDVYRFITVFLFEQEVDDLKLGGLGRHFFYRDDLAS